MIVSTIPVSISISPKSYKVYDEYLNQQYEERLRKLQEEKERYKQLSKEEKEKILQQGLWTGW